MKYYVLHAPLGESTSQGNNSVTRDVPAASGYHQGCARRRHHHHHRADRAVRLMIFFHASASFQNKINQIIPTQWNLLLQDTLTAINNYAKLSSAFMKIYVLILIHTPQAHSFAFSSRDTALFHQLERPTHFFKWLSSKQFVNSYIIALSINVNFSREMLNPQLVI